MRNLSVKQGRVYTNSPRPDKMKREPDAYLTLPEYRHAFRKAARIPARRLSAIRESLLKVHFLQIHLKIPFVFFRVLTPQTGCTC